MKEQILLLLIAGCLFEILYLAVRLWLAEHVRRQSSDPADPNDAVAQMEALVAALVTMGVLAIAILWAIGLV